MGLGKVGGRMGFYLDVHGPRDLRMGVLLVIFWMPMFLQAAPVVLPANWSVINDPYLYNAQLQSSYGGIFLKVFASPNDTFLFGFFTNSTRLWMLAIAINPPLRYSFSNFQVIWSANRNSPVADSSTLSLSGGNLVLHDNDTRLVWSTNVPPGKSITNVEMQSNGNLVLKDAGNQTLWESFSHPTDTLMQGQELGYKMALVASSSPNNGSEGNYKMVVESEALVLYTTLGNSSITQPYWISNPWGTLDEIMLSKDNSTKAHIEYLPDPNGGSLVNCMLCRESNDAFCKKQENSTIFDGISGSSICFLRLDYDGVLRWKYYLDQTTHEWLTKTESRVTNPCSLPAYCGPYGICTGSGNCKCPGSGEAGLSPIFQFRNASNDQQGCNPIWSSTSACHSGNVHTEEKTNVLELENVAYIPNTYLPSSTGIVYSGYECSDICSRNCSCAASFYWYNGNISKCFLVSELLSMYTPNDVSEINGRSIVYIKYLEIDRPKRIEHISPWKLGVGISSGGLVLFVVCVCFVMVVMRRRSVDSEEDEEFLESIPGLLPRFSFKELDTATRHFSKVLGEGGFGTVYEGILLDGSKVAVKKLGGSTQGQKEFRAEVATIGGINHQCLVRLWGFCSEGAHRMLVYECMNKGSLDRWLFRDVVLEWAPRYQIAVDTAHGLSYLHRDCRQKIIHLDVKPQNILLDDQFRAKVADFGMSKLFDKEMTEVVTKMRGTPGYLAPEWLLQSGITVKCDVYSYGMVLLEIVSGRKNMDLNAGPEKWYFPAWAVERMRGQAWKEIVDVRLKRCLISEDWEQIKKVVKIAFWCIQDTPRLRPTMTTVVQMLEGVVEVKDPPLQFDFLALSSRVGTSIGSNLRDGLVKGLSVSKDEQLDSLKVNELKSFCEPDSHSNMSPR